MTQGEWMDLDDHLVQQERLDEIRLEYDQMPLLGDASPAAHSVRVETCQRTVRVDPDVVVAKLLDSCKRPV